MASTMKAAQLTEYKKPYTLREVPIPETNGRDILIKVYAASFCHTDIQVMDGVPLHGGNTLPITGSHEAVGIIDKMGPDVDTTRFKIGDRVGTLNYYHPCGVCADCKNDDEGYVYCQREQQTLGLTRDGGFSEYMITDSLSAFHIPKEISFVDAAPLMCAGVTIYKALKRCNLKPGETVGIIGCGGGLGTSPLITANSGHLGIQFAKRMGYKVVGVDNQDEAIRVAKSLNCADLIFDARVTLPIEAEELVAGITAPTNNGHGGCAATIVLPESQHAFNYATQITRKHGIIMTVSVPVKGWNVNSFDLIFKDLNIKGSLYASVKDAEEMLKDIAGEPVHVVKRIYEFEKVNEAVEDSKRGGKIVIEFLKE